MEVNRDTKKEQGIKAAQDVIELIESEDYETLWEYIDQETPDTDAALKLLQDKGFSQLQAETLLYRLIFREKQGTFGTRIW